MKQTMFSSLPLAALFLVIAPLVISGETSAEENGNPETRVRRQSNRRRENCGQIRADIVFVLDSSISVSESEFEKSLRFVVEFMDFLHQARMITNA